MPSKPRGVSQRPALLVVSTHSQRPLWREMATETSIGRSRQAALQDVSQQNRKYPTAGRATRFILSCGTVGVRPGIHRLASSNAQGHRQQRMVQIVEYERQLARFAAHRVVCGVHRSRAATLQGGRVLRRSALAVRSGAAFSSGGMRFEKLRLPISPPRGSTCQSAPSNRWRQKSPAPLDTLGPPSRQARSA